MGKTIKLWWTFPLLILAFGLYSAVIRVFRGLGASTHLSDQFPWGLWIGFDVLSGVSLAAGAFALSGAVYVLHLQQYKSLVRSAIMTGFIGYLMVIIALLFDLGHPYRIWHPLIMWNPRSVMFEISWCVTMYTLVLATEFSAFLFERLKWDRATRIADTITVPLVILGIILSTLHQSSLGSLFLIVPYKLYPLWYSPWLPVFFFASALAIGCAMVIVESFISSRVFKKELEIELLSGLGRLLVVLIAVYGIARFIDLSDRNALSLILQPGFERCMFLAEIILAPVGAMVLLAMPNACRNRLGLFMGAMMTVCGFILNRFNVSMTGLIRSSGVKYFPSWMEISVTLLVVLLGIVLFGLAARYLNIFPLAKPCLAEGQSCVDKPSCCLSTTAKLWATAVWFSSLMLLVNGARDFRDYQPPDNTHATSTTPVIVEQTAQYHNLPKDIAFERSAESPGAVTFSHNTHLASAQCRDCHSNRFSIMGTLSARRDLHAASYCGMCHDGKIVSNECTFCHKTK